MKTHTTFIENVLLRNKDIIRKRRDFTVSNAFKLNGSFQIGES